MSQTGCKSRLSKIWQRNWHRWSYTISLNLLLQTLDPVQSDQSCVVFLLNSQKLLQFHWKSKQENFFFQTQNINYKDSNGEKSAVRVAAITLLFWYKMRRENNQPTRINLLINFNSSREEPGSFISSVRGDQGSIWLEIRLVNVELKYQFHIENVSRTATTWTFSSNKK